MNLIEFVGIEKQYRRGNATVTALRHIDLVIVPGEFVALAGPSGSGKSTLCNLAGLIDEPDRGTLSFHGRDISHCDDNERSQIRIASLGFVFQSFNLVPVFSALENVLLPLQLRGRVTPAMERQARQLLAVVGLADQTDRRPDDLSGGQQQRVAIARALITEPLLVIADEPTANLDTANAHAIIDLMREKNQALGTTFLFSTHDERLLDRVERRIHLCDGLIVDDDRGVSAP